MHGVVVGLPSLGGHYQGATDIFTGIADPAPCCLLSSRVKNSLARIDTTGVLTLQYARRQGADNRGGKRGSRPAGPGTGRLIHRVFRGRFWQNSVMVVHRQRWIELRSVDTAERVYWLDNASYRVRHGGGHPRIRPRKFSSIRRNAEVSRVIAIDG